MAPSQKSYESNVSNSVTDDNENKVVIFLTRAVLDTLFNDVRDGERVHGEYVPGYERNQDGNYDAAVTCIKKP